MGSVIDEVSDQLSSLAAASWPSTAVRAGQGSGSLDTFVGLCLGQNINTPRLGRYTTQNASRLLGDTLSTSCHGQGGGSLSQHFGTGREAALAWASLAQRSPSSSVLAQEGAGCGSVGDVPGAWLDQGPGYLICAALG